MSDKREEDADAEHREGLLTAHDKRVEHFPFETGPILGYEPDHQNDYHDEMDEAVRREVGFVVRIES